MFYDVLNKHVHSWIEDGKLNYIFSNRKKPDFILTDKSGIALALKYDFKTMIAPIILEKGKNSYAQKIINMSNNRNIPVIEDKELAYDLYSSLRTGCVIHHKYWSRIVTIYSKYVPNILNNESNNHFDNYCDNYFEIQRQKNYEKIFVNPPEKIILELSHNIFSIVEHKSFRINILGIVIHNIKARENLILKDNEFCIMFNGLAVKHGSIRYSNIDPYDQLSLHLCGALKDFAKELIGYDEIVFLFSQIKDKHPVLIQEILKCYSIGEIKKVLHGLLQEDVSVQNIITILETIADFGPKKSKLDMELIFDLDLVIEEVRKAIGRDICYPLMGKDNVLNAIHFEYEFEKKIAENIIVTENGKALKPYYFKLLMQILPEAIDEIGKNNVKPILICSTINRKLIRNITEQFDQKIIVLSASEIPREVKIEYVLSIKENMYVR